VKFDVDGEALRAGPVHRHRQAAEDPERNDRTETRLDPTNAR
jgi:hypothetical protein